jgi:glycosyltransferase involved in cell wall biosynthesis
VTTAAPKVTVVALAYNHEPYVEQCLDAVAAQTLRDYEVIVMDDASTDGTAERIRAWAARTGFPATYVFHDENRGVCACRNEALSLARGTYLASAAGDDVYEPDRLERQVAFFDSMPPDVALIFSDARRIDQHGAQLSPSLLRDTASWPPVEGRILHRLLHKNTVVSAAAMLRRTAVVDVGGWDEGVVIDDWDLWLRLAERYEVRYCPGLLASYRIVPTSLAHDPARAARRYQSRAAILRKWADHDPQARRIVRRSLVRAGLRAYHEDPASGRALLREAASLGRRADLRALAAATSVPGFPTVARLAASADYRWTHRTAVWS